MLVLLKITTSVRDRILACCRSFRRTGPIARFERFSAALCGTPSPDLL